MWCFVLHSHTLADFQRVLLTLSYGNQHWRFQVSSLVMIVNLRSITLALGASMWGHVFIGVWGVIIYSP